MEREGIFDDTLIKDVSKNEGSIQDIKYIPENGRRFCNSYGYISRGSR